MTSTAATAYHRANSALYGYFLLILAWAPLPLASNRDWSTRLLACLLLAGLLCALVLLWTGHLRLISFVPSISLFSFLEACMAGM